MSQQLQITGGAKVRSLEGVITGSTGVLGSLPINGSNGIPQLDVNGKILVSQLPNSVMEYLGTWNAATNTPTLVNGTGNAGDVYLCNVAGTVNFGAGPITFYVGDQVIYSGTIWQRASGATGSVTSVAVTETGDALTITGSPITTSGTINIGFAGTSAQYVAGDGTLVTFPTISNEAQRLITEVYNETGATLTKGTVVYINGGHGNLPTVAKALATGDATSAQTYGVVQSDIGNNNNGFVVVIGSLMDLDTQAYTEGTQLYLSSTTAGAWTSTKQYAPAHLVYVAIVTRSHPTQGVVEVKIMNGFELDELHNVSAQTPSNNDGIFYNSSTTLWENKSIATALGYTPISGTGTTNYISKFTGSTALGNSLLFDNGTNVGIGTASPSFKLDVSGTGRFTGQLTLGSTITNGTYTYTLPGATGVFALTSDLTIYVTLSTLQTITGTKIYSSLQYFDNNVYIKHGISGSSSGYTTLGASASGLNINLASGTSNNSLNFASTSASNTYIFPNATGTVALTSDLSGYLPLTGGTLTGSLTGTNASFNYVSFNNTATAPPTISGFSSLTFIDNGSLLAMNIKRSDGQRTTINLPDDGFTHQYDFPSTDGTIALTSNLSSYVPTSRTLTINGTTYDLSADRSWTISGSQWTTNGSDIYYNTGKVGIGFTSNPVGLLQLNGAIANSADAATFTIKQPSTSYNNGIYIERSGERTGYFMYVSSNADALTFRRNWVGTQSDVMVLTRDGNVGIGTTSPANLLDVVKAGTNAIRVQNTANTTDAYYIAQNTGGSAFFGINATGPYIYTAAALNFQIITNNIARMSIKNSNNGTVVFGTAEAAANSFNYYGNYSNNQPGYIIYNSSGTYIFEFNGNTKALYLGNLGTGTLYSNSGIISNTSPSDERLKENINTIEYGLKDILKLRPVSFTWKDDKINQGTQFGFIAQEVQEVIPESVKEFGDDIKYLGLEKDAIYITLINAIKELNDKIEKLENK